MDFSKKIKRLERKGIISRKPHPLIPFVLGLISLILWIIVKNIEIGNFFIQISSFLVVFSFLFAVLHLIVVRILES